MGKGGGVGRNVRKENNLTPPRDTPDRPNRPRDESCINRTVINFICAYP